MANSEKAKGLKEKNTNKMPDYMTDSDLIMYIMSNREKYAVVSQYTVQTPITRHNKR